MRQNRRNLQVFNLSFLDVVSCGFGAVIMLVLVSHTSDYRADLDSSGAADLLKSLFEFETRVSDKSRQLETLRQELSAARSRTNSLKDIQQQLQRTWWLSPLPIKAEEWHRYKDKRELVS